MKGNDKMKRINSILAIALALCACPCMIWAATWTKTASGTYSWNDTANWTNGLLPTASTKAEFISAYPMASGGHQTITGDGEASCLDVITADVDNSAVRTFAGDLTAKYATFRTGTTAISGTLTLMASANSGYYTVVGTSSKNSAISSVLDILDGGTVQVQDRQPVFVGRYPGSDAAAVSKQASGRIRLRAGGRLLLANQRNPSANSGLWLGKTTGSSTAPWFASSYVQDGGYSLIDRCCAGCESKANASMTVMGGTMELTYGDGGSRFVVGQKGYGIFQQLGGEVYVNTNHAQQTLYLTQPYSFTVGSGLAATSGLANACFYACGGRFVNASAFLIQGPETNMTGVLPASATIAGTAVVTSKTVRVGANTGDGRAVLNLNGGILSTAYLYGLNGRSGTSEINGDGGTVSFPNDGVTVADQFLYIDHINVYPGGLTVDCGTNINFGTASVAATLRSPSGLGLLSLTRGALASCVYVPRIEITGGSGSNATAIALVNYNTHSMTGIVVTCRGEGYKTGDALTVHIYRASASANTDVDGTVKTLAANAPSALVKTGTGNLSLYAQPEFDGTYEVREGRMIQTTATTGSTKVSAVVVGGDGAVFQCGSANSTATIAKSNPVNPFAALTLGTANGPGTLAIPAAASGQSAAFEQTFASLTVAGTGNTIEMASGNAAANGAKVTFGDINCPVGAEVTIPRWDSPLKVYVTGRPARTVFKRVRFEGTDWHAMVGNDGQLVPAPGFMMTIR